MATMTFNITDREMAVLDELSREQEMSKTAIMRQALALYQLVKARIDAGETMTFSGDKERVALFIGPGIISTVSTTQRPVRREGER